MADFKEIPVTSMDLSTFAMVETFISMREMSEYINENIEQALTILSAPEKGCLSMEYKESMYNVQRLGVDRYAWYTMPSDQLEILDASATLDRLYSFMPAVDIVGAEMGRNLIKMVQERGTKYKER